MLENLDSICYFHKYLIISCKAEQQQNRLETIMHKIMGEEEEGVQIDGDGSAYFWKMVHLGFNLS